MGGAGVFCEPSRLAGPLPRRLCLGRGALGAGEAVAAVDMVRWSEGAWTATVERLMQIQNLAVLLLPTLVGW